MNEIEWEEVSDIEERKDNVLPGAKKHDVTKRIVKLAMEVQDIKFSPDGKSWAVATPEGLHIYSNVEQETNTVIELEEDINL